MTGRRLEVETTGQNREQCNSGRGSGSSGGGGRAGVHTHTHTQVVGGRLRQAYQPCQRVGGPGRKVAAPGFLTTHRVVPARTNTTSASALLCSNPPFFTSMILPRPLYLCIYPVPAPRPSLSLPLTMPSQPLLMAPSIHTPVDVSVNPASSIYESTLRPTLSLSVSIQHLTLPCLPLSLAPSILPSTILVTLPRLYANPLSTLFLPLSLTSNPAFFTSTHLHPLLSTYTSLSMILVTLPRLPYSTLPLSSPVTLSSSPLPLPRHRLYNLSLPLHPCLPSPLSMLLVFPTTATFSSLPYPLCSLCSLDNSR